VTAVVQLWQQEPALAVVDVAEGFPVKTWSPINTPDDVVSRFEEEALGTNMLEPRFAVDTREAVREVMLARSHLDPVTAILVADTLVSEAERVGYDPFLVLAVIEVESNFDAKAVSFRGARGLMQLMPDTRAWMVTREPMDQTQLEIEYDIRIGVRYLALLHKGFGRIERALQAYNCGPGKLLDVMHEVSPMPEETRFYADRVLKRFAKFKKDYAYLAKSLLSKPA